MPKLRPIKKKKPVEDLSLRPIIKKLIRQGPKPRFYRALIDILDYIDREGVGRVGNDPAIPGSTLLRIMSAQIPEINELIRQHHGLKKPKRKTRA